ncbi:MAG: hypothetical protein JXA23_06350 [Bacteroidales bacterium]|nr:hypothetical protein [Bacteroidales bacterium]
MWGRRVAIGWIFGMAVLPVFSPAQQLIWRDQGRVRNLILPCDSGYSLVKLRITQQIDYSVTLSGGIYLNWEHDLNANQVMLMQDLVYLCRGETKKRFRFIEKVTHHLGFQYFFDSISRFHVDDNQFETRIECQIGKHHSAFLSALISTRLFNSYRFSKSDSGLLVRTMTSSFLTPMTLLFSGGIQLNWPFFGSLNIGLTSAKLTWIRDKEIYEALETEIFYGVRKGEDALFEYGLSIQFLINHDLLKWLHWDCDLLIFKKTDLPPDISMRNNLGFRLTKLMKARIQTRIYYEEQVRETVQLENIISVGLVVTL